MLEKIDKKKLKELEEIEKESFNNFWSIAIYEKFLENPNVFIYGLQKDGALVAFIMLMDMVDVLEITRIAVKKEYRRKGFGEELLKKIILESSKDIFLEVRITNKAAQKLYEKLGFRLISTRKNYYQDTNESALVFKFQKGG